MRPRSRMENKALKNISYLLWLNGIVIKNHGQE